MIEDLWLGTENSYKHYADIKAMQARETPGGPQLMHVQGKVAVVDVTGSLISGRAGWMSFFGITGYLDVQDSLLAAVMHPDVKSILLNVDTGGGDVAGVADLADFIAKVGKIKPVITFTGGGMLSAGLWLGSAGKTMLAAQTAMVGSIGVLRVHMEKSKMLAEDGIKVTIIRAGKYKALANPYEPLTEEAQAELQAQADHLENIFVKHVAKARGHSADAARKNYGEGRVFIGSQAKDVGLIDLVTNFDGAMNIAEALASK